MAKQTFTTGQVLTAAQMTSLQQTAMGGGSPSTKTASYVLVAADAGTVIQMNSASATTITVNTSLFAAGDSVQIQNIGSGTTTITAGTATVNSAGSLAVTQYDGGFLYFSSASSAIWFDFTQPGTTLPLTTKGDLFGYDTANARIPIGTNNQVLTADSAQALGLKWATPTAASPNYQVVGTAATSVGTNANFTFSGISGKDSLIILFSGLSVNQNVAGRIQMNINGNTTGSYHTYLAYVQSDTSTPNVENQGNSNYIVLGKLGSSSSNTVSAIVRIDGCNSAGVKPFQYIGSGNGSAGSESYIGQGFYTNTSVVTSIRIETAGQGFDAGTITVYGA